MDTFGNMELTETHVTAIVTVMILTVTIAIAAMFIIV